MSRRSLLLLPEGDFARLWDVVADHRKRDGDIDGAKMARWQAKNIRSHFPTARPEMMKP